MHAPNEEKSDDSKYSVYEELEQVFDNFSKYSLKIRERGYFKLTVGNESLQQDSNDNCVRIANFSTSKNRGVMCIAFLQQNICENT
jgi:hypothetical protein